MLLCCVIQCVFIVGIYTYKYCLYHWSDSDSDSVLLEVVVKLEVKLEVCCCLYN